MASKKLSYDARQRKKGFVQVKCWVTRNESLEFREYFKKIRKAKESGITHEQISRKLEALDLNI